MKRSGAPCARCQWLRGYLLTAGPLVALIYLQPGGALRMAGLMPPALVIGWAIVLTGAGVFALRLSAWRRQVRTGAGSIAPGSAREG